MWRLLLGAGVDGSVYMGVVQRQAKVDEEDEAQIDKDVGRTFGITDEAKKTQIRDVLMAFSNVYPRKRDKKKRMF
jgi:hypothetical protein